MARSDNSPTLGLAAALDLVAKVIERRATITILTHARLTSDGKSATVTGTDLDTEVSIALSPMERSFDVAVPAHLLRGIAAAHADVELDPHTSYGLKVTAPTGAEFTLPGLPVADFPMQASRKYEFAFDLSAAQLLADFDAVGPAISTEENRYYLNGICAHVVDGHLTFAATDGYRLHRVRRPLPDGADGLGESIFVNSMSDLFHEKVPDEWIDRIFAVMALCPQHNFQVLTKRAERMRAYMTDSSMPGRVQSVVDYWECEDDCPFEGHAPWVIDPWPLDNVWLGVSVEDQRRADERREDFRETPAAVKFVSYEPALGPVDWSGWEFVNQIISGGESGPRARPNHPDWHRATRDFCAPRGIAYFFKQWGEWGLDTELPPKLPDPALAVQRGRISIYPDGTFGGRGFFPEGSRNLTHLRRVGKKAAGRLLDGVEHSGMPSPPPESNHD